MQKKDNYTLITAILFGIAGLLNLYLTFRDGDGMKMVIAILFLIAAVVNFRRWQSRNQE